MTIMVSFDTLTGEEFEFLVVRLLRAMGFQNVFNRQFVGDRGVDVEADQIGDLITYRIAIQCKNFKNSVVGRPTVQKLDSAVKNEGFNAGLIITSSKFSNPAKRFANKTSVHITLIDGEKLSYLVKKYMKPANTTRYNEEELKLEEEYRIDELNTPMQVLDTLSVIKVKSDDYGEGFTTNEGKNEISTHKENDNIDKAAPDYFEPKDLTTIDEDCYACGTQLRGNIRYCRTCDWVFGPEELDDQIGERSDGQEELNTCTACGTPLIGPRRFCPKCQWHFKL